MKTMTRANVIAELKYWLDTYGPFTREDDDGTRDDIFADLLAAAPADVRERAIAARARKEAGFPAERAAIEARERAAYVAKMKNWR